MRKEKEHILRKEKKKRSERSNGLDTALYKKNIPLHTPMKKEERTKSKMERCMPTRHVQEVQD